MVRAGMNLKPRFDHYVGIVSAPASADCSHQQLLDLCAQPVCVMQPMPYFPGAAYAALDGAKARLDSLKESIAALRDAQAEVIAQFGGYWSLPYAPDIDTARELERSLTDEFKIPVLLNWVAIVDALLAVKSKRISVAAGYYRPEWTRASVDFLESAGFEVLWAGDVIDQGIVADHEGKLAIEAATRWDYPDEIVLEACVDAAKRAPECDAICQTGAGMRTTYVVTEVEAQAGKPLVATDIALFWAVMRTLEIKPKGEIGRLFA